LTIYPELLRDAIPLFFNAVNLFHFLLVLLSTGMASLYHKTYLNFKKYDYKNPCPSPAECFAKIQRGKREPGVLSIILKAAYRVSVRTVVAVHIGIATVEVQVPRVRTIHGT